MTPGVSFVPVEKESLNLAERADFCECYAPVAGALAAWARLRVLGGLRRRIDPEDIVQETVVRAYDRFATFDPAKGAFRAWLFGIANNVMREILVQRANRPTESRRERTTSTVFDQLPDDATSISRRAARSEAVEKLVVRLQQLEESEQRLFIFRALEGMRLDDIAAHIGVTGAAIEKRWQRLVPKLEGVFASFADP